MIRDIIDKRIDELNTDIEWLDYNLIPIDGCADLLISTESKKRINVLGVDDYKTKYLATGAVSSEYSPSLGYIISLEETIKSNKNNIESKIQNLIKLRNGI